MNHIKSIHNPACQIGLFAILVQGCALLVTNSYYLFVLNIVGINIIVVIGLNLLMGYAGQISLGHAAFYAIGAYLSAILTVTYGFPAWPTLFLALIITGGVAYVIGIPIMRLEGHYLVMATLGFGIILYIVLIQWDDVTGGPSGFAGIEPLHIGSLTFDSDRRFYYLIWPCVLLTLWGSLNLVRSRVGRGLMALRSDELVASCTGVNTEGYKVKVFVLSAVLASLAGSLYAHYIGFVSPGTFSFFYSIQVVTMVIVGGLGSLWGSVLGAALLTVLPEFLGIFQTYNVLMYGLVLMVVLVFFPEGLLPGLWFALQKTHRKHR